MERLQIADRIFETCYEPDPIMDVCLFQIKRCFPVNQASMDTLLLLHQKLPYTNRGIYFWPHALRFKPKLYNFNDELIQSVRHKIKDMPDFRATASAPTSIASPSCATPPTIPQVLPTPAVAAPHTDDTTTRMLYLKKTENPDVYELYPGNALQNKIGVAHVPTMAVSRRLRDQFKDKNVVTLLPFSCTYNERFEKWQPI